MLSKAVRGIVESSVDRLRLVFLKRVAQVGATQKLNGAKAAFAFIRSCLFGFELKGLVLLPA